MIKTLLDDYLAIEQRVSDAMKSLGPSVIGQRIRRARQREGFSIRDLASRANVSATSIVRLESGLPFLVPTLVKICSGMGLHLDRFLEADEGDELAAFHRHSDDRWYDLVGIGEGPLDGHDRPLEPSERGEIANAKGVNPMLIFKTHLENGRAWSSMIELFLASEPRSHPGEEFIFVLSGTAQITVGPRTHTLRVGEAIGFWSSEEHIYAPAPGSPLPVRLLCVRVAS